MCENPKFTDLKVFLTKWISYLPQPSKGFVAAAVVCNA